MIVWKIQPDGNPIKEYKTISNSFNVVPKGGALFVTPKLIEQLKDSQELLDNPIPVKPTE